MNKQSSSLLKIASPTLTGPDEGWVLQRKCACGQHTIAGGSCSECSGSGLKLRRATSSLQPGADNSFDVPPIVHDVLRSAGQPLDAASRSFFEPRFGHDFSHVRVHTDARASESAQAVGASAYTVGRHVVLGSRVNTAGIAEGRRLLAHELTHVVQQGSGGDRGVSGRLAIGPANDSHEREAARAEQTMASGARIGSANSLSQPRLQRSPYDVRLPESREIRVTPTSRLIPFSEIDLGEPLAWTRTQPSPSGTPEGPEPPPKVAVPKLAPESRKKGAEPEGPEIKSIVETGLTEIVTNLEVSIPVRRFGPNYTFGLPFLVAKEMKVTVGSGPPSPPFGMPPALSRLGLNLSLKALTFEFEPMMAIIRGLKELEASVVAEADIDPSRPLQTEFGIKPELSFEKQLGRSPVSIYGRFGYKLSFPPGERAAAAPVGGFGFKLMLDGLGRSPESRKR